MLAQVRAALDAIAGSIVTLRLARGAGRAFELLLMSQIALELKNRRYLVELLRSDGTRQSVGASGATFIQRGGAPGPVHPAADGPDGPTSIVFRKLGIRSRRLQTPVEWEIWNGIQFVGRSGGTHEIDIAVVPKRLGDVLRAFTSGQRPLGHGWLSIECKDVAATGSPDEMRTFVSRIYDTTLLQAHAPHIGTVRPVHRVYAIDTSYQGFGSGRVTYYQENRSVYGAIARTTGFSVGTAEMSDYYNIRRFEDLRPGTRELNEFAREVVDWLDDNLPKRL